MASFSLRTLGLPEIRRDGEPCPLTLRKGLALVAYLAEAKGPVGREVIATMLWPEDAEDLVRTRLRRLLHRVQLALGDDVLVADRTTIRWSPATALQVDSRLFEQACEKGDFELACNLYRGDFLDGFSPGDCPQFNEWAFFRRETLRGRAIQALERAVHARNAVGDFAAAVARAERLVALDPLSEVYGRHLIRNLLLAGDRTTAERHFDALTRRLREELDVAPEAETRALLNANSSLASDELPPTRYASGGGIHLAFQVHGAGHHDVQMSGGFLSHVERLWEE